MYVVFLMLSVTLRHLFNNHSYVNNDLSDVNL